MKPSLGPSFILPSSVFILSYCLFVVCMLSLDGPFSVAAEVDGESKARAEYEAAEAAVKVAESAVAPLKGAMQKADTVYADARKAADAKRQQATDAKNLSGEPGVKELKQAEDNLPVAIKALTDATSAKPPLDQLLADAKTNAFPLQQAYDAAEKAAREAEALAKVAVAAANNLEDEAKKATAQATSRGRAADAARAALARAQQSEQNFLNQVQSAPKKLAEAETQKNAADDGLAAATNQVAVATTHYLSAEQAALAAEANAKLVAEAEKQKAAAEAVARRKAANDAKAVLTQAQAAQQNLQSLANAAAQKLARTVTQKNLAEAALANARNQVAATTIASAAAEQVAQAAIKFAEEKNLAATQAAARRKSAADAAAVLDQAQQGEQQAQDKANAAAKVLADATARKNAADDALANFKNKVADATTTSAAAEKAAQESEAAVKAVSGDLAKSQDERKKAADEAPARRKAADEAKATLAKSQQSEQAARAQVAVTAKKLEDAETQKKTADVALANAGNQLTSATAANQAVQNAVRKLVQQAAANRKASVDTSNPASDLALKARCSRKRRDAIDAESVLSKAQQCEQQARVQATAAAKELTDATVQKKAADDALASAINQSTVATNAYQSAEKVAREGEAAARRIAAEEAKTALALARQGEIAAQAQAAAAALKLAEVEPPKKAADVVLANARTQVAAASTANQVAHDAAREVVQLDEASRQATADATAKRKTAVAAKDALAPVKQKQEQAAIKANAAEQELARAETRKKTAEEGLENLKKRIVAAKQTYMADEEAAKAAEAVAAPLKVESEKTRAAYSEAIKVADDKRAMVEQAKAVLYRLLASRQVANIMESSDPVNPANRIDEIVFAKLKALGIKPVLCSDSVFIRRAYLDTTGTLPSAEEAKVFIRNPDKNKRVALIDRLLDLSTHVDYWAMKWSDILKVKAEFPVKVWPNAAQAYHRWIWESINRNKPYDQFVRELLTSSGSNFRAGPVNFYRAIQNKTPEGIADAVGLALMGARVHFWQEDRRAGMAVFFSQVGYKPTSEWKEEIVFWDPLKSAAVPGCVAPGVDSIAKALTATDQIPQALTNALTENGPLAVVFPDGTRTTIPPNRDPREVFADWLIRSENPWFTKAIVNRTWTWVMGRGIIHEPDNIRDDNPPCNPELLAYLEKELVSSGYNLKHLTRLILTSTAYQFSSIQRSQAPEAKANFACYPMRRVEAEVLIDALNSITGGSDLYTSAVPEPFTYIPKDMSAVELADGSVTSSFLTLFGRSARATGMENERVSELASTQWLHMLNSAAIQGKLQGGPKLAAILSSGGKPNEIVERLCLTILSRFPTDADFKAADEYAKSGATKGSDVWIDLAWAFINSPEFLLRH